MLRIIAVTAFVVLALAPVAPAQPTKAEIRSLIQDAMKAWEVPGCAVVIVLEGKVLVNEGFGVRELGKDDKVTSETQFPLASLTKAFTTTLLAKLVEEGKLAWDDPVRQHLPYFRLADPLADANITIRDLVAHRSGVGSHDLLWYHNPATPEEMVRSLAGLKPSSSLRSRFEYQSVMFTAAGLAAGNAAGSSWEEAVKKRLLDPLEMKSTKLTSTKTDNRASPHRRGRDGKIAPIPFYVMDRPNPAGSMHSTPSDLAIWLKFQLANGAYDRKQVVAAEALAETHTPQTIIRLEGENRLLNPETLQTSYGMGWVVYDYRGQQLSAHAGVIDGFRGHITLLREAKLGVAIFANLHATRMNLALSNTLVDYLLRLPARDWNDYYLKLVKEEEESEKAQRADREKKRQTGTKPAKPLDDFAGEYEAPAYGKAKIVLEKGVLRLEWSSFRCPLEHFHFDTFTVKQELLRDPLAVFRLGADGAIESMKLFEVEFKKSKR